VAGVRLNAAGMESDPAFEDALKNFVGARLVEDDLDRIGDERMLKVVLLDQLLVEYLMGVQDALIDEVARAENAHAVAAHDKQRMQDQLEANKAEVDELRDQLAKKQEQANQLRACRQHLNAFRCSYCSKMFKSMYFLEKHMVRHEASNLRVEKESDARVAEQRAKELEHQKQLDELERARNADKNKDLEELKGEFKAIKNQLAVDHDEKANLELKLVKVNQELNENLRKMEIELAEKLKALEAMKSQQPSYHQNMPGSALQGPPSAINSNLPQNTGQNQEKPQFTNPNLFHSMQNVAWTGDAIAKSAHPLDKPANQNPGIINQSNQPAPGAPLHPQMNPNLFELIQFMIHDNEKKGNLLVPDVRRDINKDPLHPQVIASISNTLNQRGLNLENYRQTELGMLNSTQIMEILKDGLVKDRLMSLSIINNPNVPYVAGVNSMNNIANVGQALGNTQNIQPAHPSMNPNANTIDANPQNLPIFVTPQNIEPIPLPIPPQTEVRPAGRFKFYQV
jgi:hypothetical protein